MEDHPRPISNGDHDGLPSNQEWGQSIVALLDNNGATIDRYTAVARDADGSFFTIVASRDQAPHRGILEVQDGLPESTDDTPLSLDEIDAEVARAIWRAFRMTRDERVEANNLYRTQVRD